VDTFSTATNAFDQTVFLTITVILSWPFANTDNCMLTTRSNKEVIFMILRICSRPRGFFKKQVRISRFGINSILGLSNQYSRLVVYSFTTGDAATFPVSY
jgi:hypothetical protein